MKLEINQNEEDQKRLVTDEHWVLDIPHIAVVKYVANQI